MRIAMRTATVCLVVGVVGVVAGLMLSTIRTTQAFAAPVQLDDQNSSLVGQSVQVNFRQADDIAFPYQDNKKAHLAAKLEFIQGTVIAATATWIELKTDRDAGFTHVWVPVSEIAYVNDVEPSKAKASARP